MTCGCTQTAPGAMIQAKACTLPAVQSERAAMCLTCWQRRGDGTTGDLCGVTRLTIGAHVAGKACPKRKHPEGGLIRWLGVQWAGVPWPVRVWLHATSKLSAIDSLPGCGCVLAVKTLFQRLGHSESA
jgi:hypothetical protein